VPAHSVASEREILTAGGSRSFFLREPKAYSKPFSANCSHTKTDYSFAGIQGSHFDTGCRRIIETYL
jgi:hypothetical protein